MAHKRTEHGLQSENHDFIELKHNQQIHAKVVDRLAHIGRKMSRGAANIYRMIKTGGIDRSRRPHKNHHKSGHFK